MQSIIGPQYYFAMTYLYLIIATICIMAAVYFNNPNLFIGSIVIGLTYYIDLILNPNKRKHIRLDNLILYTGGKKMDKQTSQVVKNEYPYKKLFIKDEEILQRFDRLKRYQLQFKHFKYYIGNLKDFPNDKLLYRGEVAPYIKKKFPDGAYTLVIVKDSDYDNYNNISDYFQESARIRCKRHDQEITPFEYWKQKNVPVANNADDIKEQREKLFGEYYECTNFRPSLMVGFGKYFNATSILDISAGWGDRLVGALALGADYVGVDPNPAVHKGYEEMIKFFGGDKENYMVIQDTFEDATLPEKDYDLVFSSPPYFDLEDYAIDASPEDRKKQSHVGKESVDEWLNEFLLVSLRKAFDALIPSGHMVININEVKGRDPFINKMIDEVNKFPSIKYLGCISQKTENSKKSPQPFWIWKKI